MKSFPLVDAYRKIRNTCRFLLGNISDLDTSGIKVGDINKEELAEIDSLRSAVAGLVKKVSNSYETFAFYEVYHTVLSVLHYGHEFLLS